MIRPARIEDALQIGKLHARIWGSHGRTPDREADLFAVHFRHVYFENPWYDEACGPLVHEDRDGRITGVLGIVRRPLKLGDRRLWMAISSELAFDPESRSQLAAVQMVKRFLNGPQEVSLADSANRKAQKLWQGLGGTTSQVHSYYWWRPLRPLGFLCSLLKRRRSLTPIACCAAPFAWIGDSVLARVPGNPLRTRQAEGRLLPLTPEVMQSPSGSFVASGTLCSDPTPVSIQWVWQRLDEMFDRSRLHRQVVQSTSGEVLGWFIYVMQGKTADVWQVVARRDSAANVLSHLWSHASEQGAAVVTGRVDPQLTSALADAHCLFTARGPLVLTHARDPLLLAQINSGSACLSHLDGERLLSCQYDDDATPLVKFGAQRPCDLPNNSLPTSASPATTIRSLQPQS